MRMSCWANFVLPGLSQKHVTSSSSWRSTSFWCACSSGLTACGGVVSWSLCHSEMSSLSPLPLISMAASHAIGGGLMPRLQHVNAEDSFFPPLIMSVHHIVYLPRLMTLYGFCHRASSLLGDVGNRTKTLSLGWNTLWGSFIMPNLLLGLCIDQMFCTSCDSFINEGQPFAL